MDINKLVRDASRVHDCLHETPEGMLIAKKPVKIYIPARFNERLLASVGSDTYIVGIYAIVTPEGFYGVSLVNARIKIQPTAITTINIQGESYYEFSFDAGAVITEHTSLVKDDKVLFRIYDEFMSKGRIPWYVSYIDLGRIFSTAKKHAGAKGIGEEQEVIELIASMLARDKKDRTIYFRQTLKTMGDLKIKQPTFISLRSVQYSATNTTDKMVGSYWTEGLTSALVNPSKRQERIEGLLMM